MRVVCVFFFLDMDVFWVRYWRLWIDELFGIIGFEFEIGVSFDNDFGGEVMKMKDIMCWVLWLFLFVFYIEVMGVWGVFVFFVGKILKKKILISFSLWDSS